MKTYCIICEKDTENKNPKVLTPLSKIPGLNILF